MNGPTDGHGGVLEKKDTLKIHNSHSLLLSSFYLAMHATAIKDLNFDMFKFLLTGHKAFEMT